MKRSLVVGAILALGIGVSLTAAGAPYEDQKLQIQKVQQAKLRAAAASPDCCAAMQPRTAMMKQMQDQMAQARSVDQMTPDEMRAWVKEHNALMERMFRAMPRE